MRQLLSGTWLNAIAGSLTRYPAWRVLVWDPAETTINEVASGRALAAPRDLTPYVVEIGLTENSGFESGDDPTFPRADFSFTSNPNAGLRRGLVEDGVIVRVLAGDRRIPKEDWTIVFTGTFRGRPGEDPGTPADKTKGLTATAYGREERYLNLQVTTRSFPADTDLGAMALAIAREHMELGQDEILFGSQGFPLKHVTNQIVELPALQAIYECLFPVGKKPKFDAQGRLVAVDVRLDKPAARVYPLGDPVVRSARGQPNQVDVNNVVVLRGLAHELTKIVQEAQRIVELAPTTGWFERDFDEEVYFSADHTQRVQDTYLVTVKRIRWADADWTQVDEFHGRLEINTRYLANVQAFLLVTHLAARIAIAIIDYIVQQSGGPAGTVLAIIRLGLELAAWAALLGFLWATSHIARGKYEVWGNPFEFVYQELVAKHGIEGLLPEEERTLELRNDFISTMEQLDERCEDLLKRELVKDQVWQIEILDDPLLEVDDVIELSNGDRFYIASASRTYRRGEMPILQLTCWQVADGTTRPVDAVEIAGVEA
jgi:hypothetical protein